MSKRKTIKVAEVMDAVDAFMAHSDEDWTRERRGMYSLMERILHDTGNYKGFRYILKGGATADHVDVGNGDYDDSRRVYNR